MNKFKIKRDDMVIVTAGKSRGATGRVLKLLRRDSKVIVEKVNLVQRHVKPKGDQPGGTVEKEAPIHISNVALWDASESRKIRVGWRTLDDGTKKRFDKKTGQVIDA
jgi:large subunit ribosomal protein L24